MNFIVWSIKGSKCSGGQSIFGIPTDKYLTKIQKKSSKRT